MGIALKTADGRVQRPYGGVWSGVALSLAETFAGERSRWGLWLPVMLGMGIAVYFQLDDEPAMWIGPSAMLLCGALVIFLRSRPLLPLLLFCLMFTSLGFAAAQLRTWSLDAPVLERKIGPVLIEGRILRVEPREKVRRITVDSLKIGQLGADRTPDRIRLRVSQRNVALGPGDRVRLRAVLYPPAGPAAPGAFDFARRAYFQRLGAVGYVVSSPEIIESGEAGGIELFIARLRHDLTQKILQALPVTAGAIAAALMTGERGAIPEETLAAMRDSGLAHLLAISGLHIGLIGGFIFFAVRLGFATWEHAALHWPIKKWAAIVAFFGCLAYLLISGMTLPTQRAFLMLSLVLLAVLIDRSAISMNLVAWAAAAILLLAPESLMSVSFQMSFAAVTALVAFYEAITARNFARGERRLPMARGVRYLSGVLATTLIASLATAPFAVFHFNRLALLGVLANLVAVPLAALWIMPLALISFVMMPFGLEEWPLAAMGWGIEAVLAVAGSVQGLPGSITLIPAVPVWTMGLIAFGGLWLCLWRKVWRHAGVVAILIGLVGWTSANPPDLFLSVDGRMAGLRTTSGELVLPFGGRGFAVETWRRRSGLDATMKGPKPTDVAGLQCDSIGCIYRKNGRIIALVKESAALSDDCPKADILISRSPVKRRRCPGPQILVDRFDLWRNGPHAIFFGADKMEVRSVGAEAGTRPWQIYPRSRRRK
jgi:competence protein ComEC